MPGDVCSTGGAVVSPVPVRRLAQSPFEPAPPARGALAPWAIGGCTLLLASIAAGALAQTPAASPPGLPTAAVSAPAGAAPAGSAQSPVEDLFARKCGSCHTVGKGVRVGPDLKNVHKQRSRAWMESFVAAPSTMLDTDADARNLLAEFKGVRMPDLGLPPRDVKSLVDLIMRCSVEPCNLAGKFTPATMATGLDIARGRELFLGLAPLKAGAAPCLSCHTVRGVRSAVPGGTLAKDLTNVFARLGDGGLDAALASPAFPLMNKIFASHPLDPAEVFALRAFLYQANRGGEPARESSLSVLLIGALGAVVVLIILNAAWGRRLRGVRWPLMHERPPKKKDGEMPGRQAT